MSQEFISIDEARLEFSWVGVEKSDLPVLVFLHEGLGCLELWRDFPDFICRKLGMRGFVYSRAGYGNSSPCTLPRPITYMHDEGISILPQVLDLAGINSAILIGHSDGGSIALIHAGTDRSDRIKAIITLAAHVFSEEEVRPAFTSVLAAYQSGDLRTRLQKYHGDNVDVAFFGWNDVWMSSEFEDWNLEEFLPGIDVPSLIVQGANDEYGTISQVEAILEGIGPKSCSHIIPDCGHSPHSQQRQITTDIICDFVQQLEL